MPISRIQSYKKQLTINLPVAAHLSVTVHRNSDNKLVRTLAKAELRGAGKQLFYWDMTDDFGRLCPDVGYHLKWEYNHIECVPDPQVIGNTSLHPYSVNGHKGSQGMIDIVYVNGWCYYVTGAAEGGTETHKFNSNAIQVRYDAHDNRMGAYKICTDGTNVFVVGLDNWNSNKPFVVGYVPSATTAQDTQYHFTNGTPYAPILGANPFVSSIQLETGEINFSDFECVGDYLLVALAVDNKIIAINKVTGNITRTTVEGVYNIVPVSANQAILFYKNGSQFVSARFAIGSNGSLTLTASFPYTERVVATSFYDGKIFILTEAGQLKKYSPSGNFLVALGTLNYYANRALISDTQYGIAQGCSIAHQADGKYWILERQNFRYNRYGIDDVMIDNIAFLPGNLKLDTCNNAPDGEMWLYTLAGLEFRGRPADGVGSFKLYRNFGSNPVFNDSLNNIKSVTILDGKVIGRVCNNAQQEIKVVELTDAGLVDRSDIVVGNYQRFLPDGTLRRIEGKLDYVSTGITMKVYDYAKTGVATWSTVPSTVLDITGMSWTDVKVALFPLDGEYDAITPNGLFHVYGKETSVCGNGGVGCPTAGGYHHQAYNSDGVRVVNALEGTLGFSNFFSKFPKAFPNNSIEAGNRNIRVGDLLLNAYNGEFYNGGGQVDYTWIINEWGQMVAMFGVSAAHSWDAYSLNYGSSRIGFAGNARCPVAKQFTMQSGKQAIMRIVNTESLGSGLPVWWIKNIDSRVSGRIDFLQHHQQGVTATYYADDQMAAAYKVDTAIHPEGLNLVNIRPDGIADSFSAIFKCYIKPEHKENTTFKITTNGKVRLVLAGMERAAQYYEDRIIDGWGNSGTHTLTGTFDFSNYKYLSSGNDYVQLILEYAGQLGDNLQLRWSSASLLEEVIHEGSYVVDQNYIYTDTKANLMENLPYSAVLENRYGFFRSPESNPDGSISNTRITNVRTDCSTWQRGRQKSIFNRLGFDNCQMGVKLGDNHGLKSWSLFLSGYLYGMVLTGQHTLDGGLDINDNNGRVIVRIELRHYDDENTNRITLNGIDTGYSQFNQSVYQILADFRMTVTFDVTRNKLVFTYPKGTVVASKYDAQADAEAPTTFVNNYHRGIPGNLETQLIFDQLYFSANSKAALTQAIITNKDFNLLY